MAALSPAADRKPRAGDMWSDRVFAAVALAAGLLVLLILALIAYITTSKAWPAFRHEGLGFITSKRWEPNNNHFGALAFIYGTVVSAAIALVFAVPLSMGIALCITELASKQMRTLVTYVIDLLAAIPSVVYGFWALAALKSPAKNVYEHVADTAGKAPGLGRVFGGRGITGAGFMTAGLVLAIMITPIITSLAREVFLTVPQDDKNAALAMGATRWEMLRVAVFPRVRSGLVGSVMLGLGRALGETIAVALVIGGVPQITSHIFQTGDTMPSVIAHNFGEAAGGSLQRAALIGMGVVLFGITILVNIAARLITRRTSRSLGAAQ